MARRGPARRPLGDARLLRAQRPRAGASGLWSVASLEASGATRLSLGNCGRCDSLCGLEPRAVREFRRPDDVDLVRSRRSGRQAIPVGAVFFTLPASQHLHRALSRASLRLAGSFYPASSDRAIATHHEPSAAFGAARTLHQGDLPVLGGDNSRNGRVHAGLVQWRRTIFVQILDSSFPFFIALMS